MGIDLSLSQRNDMSDSAWPLFTRGRVNQVNPFATPVSAQQMPRKRGSTTLLAARTLRQVIAATSCGRLPGGKTAERLRGRALTKTRSQQLDNVFMCPLRSGCDSRGGSARERWRSSSHASSLANSLYLNLPVVLNLLPPRTLLTPPHTLHTPNTPHPTHTQTSAPPAPAAGATPSLSHSAATCAHV